MYIYIRKDFLYINYRIQLITKESNPVRYFLHFVQIDHKPLLSVHLKLNFYLLFQLPVRNLDFSGKNKSFHSHNSSGF